MFKSKSKTQGFSNAFWRRPLTLGIFASALLVISVVAATVIFDSVSQGMRAATGFVMPVGLLWLFLLAGTVTLLRHGQLGWAVLFLGCFLALGLLGNGQFAHRCAATIEQTYPEDNESEFDTVIVLGGGTKLTRSGTPELSGAGERVFSAAQLWHQARTKQIIITGGDADDPLAPNVVSRDLLTSVGVPDESIISLTGDNTTQEMQSLREWFSESNSTSDQNIGLITSAFHLPRAMRLAEGNDLTLMPLPCAYLTGKPRAFSPRQLVPDAHSLSVFSTVAKEWLAKLLGR